MPPCSSFCKSSQVKFIYKAHFIWQAYTQCAYASQSQINVWFKCAENYNAGAPTVTSVSQRFWPEAVEQAAHSGFRPFTLSPRTFHLRSRWSTHIGAPSAGEVREAKAREASSHSRVLLILLILVCCQCRLSLRTAPLLSQSPSSCLPTNTNNHIISQQQLGNPLSLFPGQAAG